MTTVIQTTFDQPSTNAGINDYIFSSIPIDGDVVSKLNSLSTPNLQNDITDSTQTLPNDITDSSQTLENDITDSNQTDTTLSTQTLQKDTLVSSQTLHNDTLVSTPSLQKEMVMVNANTIAVTSQQEGVTAINNLNNSHLISDTATLG
jgi:hypothetical protein